MRDAAIEVCPGEHSPGEHSPGEHSLGRLWQTMMPRWINSDVASDPTFIPRDVGRREA